MKKPAFTEAYSPKEELANALSHGLGILAGIGGMVYLFTKHQEIDSSVFWSCLVFLLSVVTLYLASTLYHSVKSKKQKLLFKKLDHISIYLLIAGTFTPFCWGVLGHTALGKNLLWAIWLIALAGIVFKVFYTGKLEKLSLASYLGMGWLGFVMFDELATVLNAQVVNLMLYGGLSYTTGVIFYVMKKLPFHHAIWHLFVLGGTGFHLYAILTYVVG